MERATEVIPALKGSEIVESMNGLFSFTVDNFPLMGEWSGLKGFWVAEAVWITHACGVARAIAEWIVDGHPTLAVHECDVNRFESHQRVATKNAAHMSRHMTRCIRCSQWNSSTSHDGFLHRQQELGSH
jgi:hypothetical protein